MRSPALSVVSISFLCLWTCVGAARADWPMWRGNAQRSAATADALPSNLKLAWSRRFGPSERAWDDPLNLDLLSYDRVLEPIVLGDRLFVGLNQRDQVAALDAATGDRLWTFFADAPVRLPAVGWGGRVYFCSDDGALYCVEAASGELVWRFSGAPSPQKALGNQRLCSAWPARGGPVIQDGVVYFAASIWPMMGTYLYALDAETGDVRWVNDRTGFQYIKQPHSAPSFAGVAPQGAMAVSNDALIVPGGRSVPAVFDRETGELRYFEINAGGKGTGGSFVCADANRFYVHTRLKGVRAFDVASGLKTAFMPNEPVLHDGRVYSAETRDDQPVVVAYGPDDKELWTLPADGGGDLILAGGMLYAAGPSKIAVIRPPTTAAQAKVVAEIPVKGEVGRLLAANGRLYAVTTDGVLHAFSDKANGEPRVWTEQPQPLQPKSAAGKVQKLLDTVAAQGYSLWFGRADSELVEGVAANSPFTQFAVIDTDAQRVAALRTRLDAAGVYGKITAHTASPLTFKAPSYIAHMATVDESLSLRLGDEEIREVYRSVRPYGGVLQLLTATASQAASLADRLNDLSLEQARVEIQESTVRVFREGPLPGAADWTHQYGDVGNSIKSDDQRVKLPLGVLWFGGSSNMDVLPRHGHGPPEQVVGGRLFIQGMNSLSCRDVYTGRVLWKREFKDLGTYDVYYDETYKNTPLNPAYNQVHIPGANGRGVNYVVADDAVYILEGPTCHVLDPDSGEIVRDIRLPKDEQGAQPAWGYIGVYGDLLLGGLGFANYRERHNLEFEADAKLRRNRAGFGSKSLDRAASRGLVAFDRHTGKVLWKLPAIHSFWHNGIVAGGGRVYCLDRNPRMIEEAMRRRGLPQPDSYRIVAVDAQTGKPQWEVNEGIFGTWLGYSEEFDLLLQAGAAASDRLYVEAGEGMAVYQAASGEVQWRKDTLKYAGPCILHHEWIITNTNSYQESAGAFHIQDGRQKMVENPVTGELRPWKMTRAYGCNNIVASENLLTFRSGAAGFYDLVNDSGTGNFGGFKSGCTSNLIVANGVLNAPDYTRTCSCSYQNQTSLALVHMPELEFWTVNPLAADDLIGKRIRRLGVNLGAPGDRRDRDGTLWLEYPAVGGPSAPLALRTNPEAKYFRKFSSRDNDDPLAWVSASGVRGLTSLTLDLTIRRDVSLAGGVPVASPEDDAEEGEDGAVGLGSSDLELTEDGGGQTVGIRFANLPLARGTKIRGAYLQFTCDEPSSGTTSLIISGEAADSAASFQAESHDVSSRPRTQAEVSWRPEPWTRTGERGPAQRSPDIASILQEIVNRDGWAPGSAAAFIITGVGKRVAVSMQPPGADAVRLVVDADETQAESAAQGGDNNYRVRLVFASPADSASRRVFDVRLADSVQRVSLEPGERVEHEWPNAKLNGRLKIEFKPIEGEPLLNGVALEMLER